jgi:hypothetical protein
MINKKAELGRYDPAPMYPDLDVQTKIRLEQAEVGQSPTLLAICAANGGLRILQGYFTAFLPMK